jgi:hypothetical protein
MVKSKVEELLKEEKWPVAILTAVSPPIFL